MMKLKNAWKRFAKHLNRVFHSLPTAAILSVVGGILFIVFPVRILSLLMRLIGVALVLYGVLRISALLAGREEGERNLLSFLMMLTSVTVTVVGLILIVSPEQSLRFLTVMVGAYLLFDGAIKLYRLLMSASLLSSMYGISPEGRAERILFTVLCFLTVGAGLWLLIWPGDASETIAVLIGAALLISGVQGIFSGYIMRKKQRRNEMQNGNFYTDDFIEKK